MPVARVHEIAFWTLKEMNGDSQTSSPPVQFFKRGIGSLHTGPIRPKNVILEIICKEAFFNQY